MRKLTGMAKLANAERNLANLANLKTESTENLVWELKRTYSSQTAERIYEILQGRGFTNHNLRSIGS